MQCQSSKNWNSTNDPYFNSTGHSSVHLIIQWHSQDRGKSVNIKIWDWPKIYILFSYSWGKARYAMNDGKIFTVTCRPSLIPLYPLYEDAVVTLLGSDQVRDVDQEHQDRDRRPNSFINSIQTTHGSTHSHPNQLKLNNRNRMDACIDTIYQLSTRTKASVDQCGKVLSIWCSILHS